MAKSAERKPGTYPAEHAQVCHLGWLKPAALMDLLAATPVGDVWGVGPRLQEQLRASGITNAAELARMDATTARLNWSVVLERTLRELQGTPCIAFEDSPAPRKQIAGTRELQLAGYEVYRFGGSELADEAGQQLVIEFFSTLFDVHRVVPT